MNKPMLDLAPRTPWRVAKREREPEEFLPYARHVGDIVVTDDGSLIAVLQLDGISFETADKSDLNGWHEKLNGILRNVADERVAWVTHVVRRSSEDYPGGTFRSDFARDLDAQHKAHVAGQRAFVNELYLTIVMRPAVGAADKLAVSIGRLFSTKDRVWSRLVACLSRSARSASYARFWAIEIWKGSGRGSSAGPVAARSADRDRRPARASAHGEAGPGGSPNRLHGKEGHSSDPWRPDRRRRARHLSAGD